MMVVLNDSMLAVLKGFSALSWSLTYISIGRERKVTIRQNLLTL